MEALESFAGDMMDKIMDMLNLFLQGILGGGVFHDMGIAIWNWAMVMIGAVSATTPAEFSSETWNFITGTVLDFTLGIGAALLNIFYFINVIRHSTNLKENFTLEIFVDNMTKMLFGNILMLNGLDLMNLLFDIASISSGEFLIENPPSFAPINGTDAHIILGFVFSFIFMVVSFVCAGTIFLTLYNRYLDIYLLVAVYPIAFSTIPGGAGINRSASAWVRTFLSKTFEIIVIAISISIAAKMCSSIDFTPFSGMGDAFSCEIQMLQSMATMIILTGSVKGTDMFMQRALGL